MTTTSNGSHGLNDEWTWRSLDFIGRREKQLKQSIASPAYRYRNYLTSHQRSRRSWRGSLPLWVCPRADAPTWPNCHPKSCSPTSAPWDASCNHAQCLGGNSTATLACQWPAHQVGQQATTKLMSKIKPEKPHQCSDKGSYDTLEKSNRGGWNSKI